MGKDNLISESGVIYPSGANETLDLVVSWHDMAPIRVWISSRKANDVEANREIVSIEFQYVGDSPSRVSAEEKRMRMKLISFQNLSTNIPSGLLSQC